MICTHCEQTIDRAYHVEDGLAWCSNVCLREWMAQGLRELREERRAEDYAALRACELAGVDVRTDGQHYYWTHERNSSCMFDTRRQALNSATAYLAYKNGGEQ